MSQKKKTGSSKSDQGQRAQAERAQVRARVYEARRTGLAKKTNQSWIWIGLVVALAAVAIVLFMNRQDRSTAASRLPAEISVAEAAEKRAQGAFILDVREPVEWETVHIPEATLIPLGELAGRAAELPRDQEIVVVCRSGNRSATGRDILKEAGFEQVTSMAGGMNE
jgi:rhodanese-related sulfurtransferase